MDDLRGEKFMVIRINNLKSTGLQLQEKNCNTAHLPHLTKIALKGFVFLSNFEKINKK